MEYWFFIGNVFLTVSSPKMFLPYLRVGKFITKISVCELSFFDKFICGIAFFEYFIFIILIFSSIHPFSVNPRITFNRRFYFMVDPRGVFIIRNDHFVRNVLDHYVQKNYPFSLTFKLKNKSCQFTLREFGQFLHFYSPIFYAYMEGEVWYADI